MAELKEMYRKVMDDHFPDSMTITFGEQILTYRKRSWKIPDEESAEVIEKGLRYGENPGQEAARRRRTQSRSASHLTLIPVNWTYPLFPPWIPDHKIQGRPTTTFQVYSPDSS